MGGAGRSQVEMEGKKDKGIGRGWMSVTRQAKMRRLRMKVTRQVKKPEYKTDKEQDPDIWPAN